MRVVLPFLGEDTVSAIFFSLLCCFSLAAVPLGAVPPSTAIPPQVRNIQRIQIQQEFMNLSAELAQKNQEKSDLESQLSQLKAPLVTAKTFKLNSQVRKLSGTEAEVKNRLQQLSIEIKELTKKQNAMMAALAN